MKLLAVAPIFTYGSLILLGGAMVSLIIILWRNNGRKKRINRKLSLQNREIERINGKLSHLIDEARERNETLQKHVATLLEFSKSKVVNFGSPDDALKDIARMTAQTLNVSRISIWGYDSETRTLQSAVCYNNATQQFLDPIVLDLKQFPKYERALKIKRVIDASDARHHPDTAEFHEPYLNPLNIYSMLDVTYSVDGTFNGLICCEQQDHLRTWRPEDIIFASSVADITAMTFRSAQRRDYEKKLRVQSREITRMNELLEQRVMERTTELQSRNEQLTEYAFINSHLLRSPVSKILGLIDLLDVDKSGDPKEILTYLKRTCADLDEIVQKITVTLDNGGELDRNDV